MIPAGRVIGVDLGSRRIGVAVSDSAQSVATPVTAIQRSGDRRTDHRALAAVVHEYGAVGVVVGLPLSLSGSSGPSAMAANEEIVTIREVLPVEVETVDERFTTRVASAGLRAAGRKARRQREVIDAGAAAELLQTWLSRRRAAAEP
jgi:putative Holliday junction resolvase